jgi:hypothetical protein
VKSLAISIIFLIFSLSIAAQDTKPVKSTKAEKKQAKRERINEMSRLEEEGESGFHKQSGFGFRFNSDGYGMFYELGKIKSAYKTTIFQIELNEKKHKKEERQSRTDGAVVFGNPFIYGKQNNFYQLKLGIGQQYMIGGKGNKNGIGVYLIYEGGFAAGLLRPYYVDIESPPNSGRIQQIKYSQADSAEFMGQSILGSSGLGTGWGEMKFAPGIHAKMALRFDYGRFNNILSALEAGFNFEYYFTDIEQMVGVTPKNYFANSYIAIIFGSRK